MLMRSRTLIRKTSLLRKIEPIARRSSFANKDHLQLTSSCRLASAGFGERRNDLEIVKGRAKALHDPTRIDLLFTMSEITHFAVLVRTNEARNDVFADDC